MRLAALALALLSPLAAQPQQPNTAAQREAMKKLDFIAGRWTGEATVHPFQGGAPMKLTQTEDVQYKLAGLIMLVEGTGRDESGKVVFNAVAVISYDDAAKVYRFRSYTDGRYLDTDLKVLDKAFEWGFSAGPAKVKYNMRINEKGEWHEVGEVAIGSNPPRKTVELLVRKPN
jgi:hypothetical protein